MFLQRIISFAAVVALTSTTAVTATASEAAEPDTAEKSRKVTITAPDLYGTLRMRSEFSTEEGEARFMVRTARVGLLGKFGSLLEYKAELDLCDRGEVKVTDVWARFALPKGFKVQLGQMRMPFTFGSARAPHVYLFADRPFVDKQFIGPRNVGLKGIYACSKAGITVEGGVFNSTANTKHATWQKALSAAAKVLWAHREITLIAGYESLAASAARSSNVDAGITWHHSGLTLEGEYVYRHYNSGRFGDAHAYNFTADYKLPLNRGVFDNISFQGRFDGMTDYSNGSTMGEGIKAAMTEPEHQRLTLGATLAYIKSKYFALIRLNYENYFYGSAAKPSADDNNKLVAEVVIHF